MRERAPRQSGPETTPALTIGQAAEILGVSISTLRNWDRDGKFPATRHPINQYRIYSQESVLRLRERIAAYGVEPENRSSVARAESRFDVAFVAPLALTEKQIQQAYRPYIQVHKWFARRPGSLFRALLLSEFGDDEPLSQSYYRGHSLSGRTILDPFMGGGTPVVEANRLGMNVIGCDINPMAAWIVRQELSALDVTQLRAIGEEVAQAVADEVGRYYTTRCLKCGTSAEVKYFLWVKAFPCPSCGKSVELFPGYLIAENERHPNHVLFCPSCRDLFEVKRLPERGEKVRCGKCKSQFQNEGVAHKNRYRCGHCRHEGRYPHDLAALGPPEHSLVAIEYHCAACKPAHKGRFFKAPDAEDLGTYAKAATAYNKNGSSDYVPDDSIPKGDETTRLLRWGYRRFAQLFNKRQLLSLVALLKRIGKVEETTHRHALATVFSDFLRYQNMLSRYDTYALKCQDIFSVHGFPVGLLQCENNVLGIPQVGTGGFRHFLKKYLEAKEYNLQPFETKSEGGRKRRIVVAGEHIRAEFVDRVPRPGASRQAWIIAGSVADLDLPPSSVDAVITDPPYFDNVQYAELMDFCYIWLRKFLKKEVAFFRPTSTRTPEELTGNKTAGRDLLRFSEGLSRVYQRAAAALRPGGLFAFTYHHNDVVAYLPVIVALLDAGLKATASLPCPAEMSASLHIARTGSSVVDTILMARKGPDGLRPSDVTPTALKDLLARQVAWLRRGGVKPTEGDLRCMVLGLVAVCAVRELAEGWKPQADIASRLQTAQGYVDATLKSIGGLDALAAALKDVPVPAKKGHLLLFSSVK
jgi:excisionase family DNA binding protein